MTEFVVESVLHNLILLIQKDSRPFLSFDQDLTRLANMFTTIKASLEDAEEKQFSDTRINNWVRKINDVAHMVDDIIDEFAYETLGLEYRGVEGGLSNKVQCSCLSSFHLKHVIFGYKIAKKMKKISERLKEIVEEKNKFHLSETEMIAGRRNEVIEGCQTTFFFSEPLFYGREDDKTYLLSFLTRYPYGHGLSEDKLRVFAIEGPNGIGKTTFAKFIFDHPTVVNYFELRIWVSSIRDFSLKRMIEAIIKAAIGCDCEDLDLELVQKKLQYLLQRKRFLLVLDFELNPDLESWYTFLDNWEKLKSVLACGEKGASVLVPTPHSVVAQFVASSFHDRNLGETICCQVLSMLYYMDCWELFEQQVFEPNEEKPFELLKIGKEIVEKCEGAPLAAKLLGGLLHFTRDQKQWLNVKESSIWRLPRIKIFETPALILSYLNLPINLKKCFAYCAIFPKGETIRKQYLIEQWMAHGLISSYGWLDAESVGDDVWNELYRRSFFQDIETDEFGNITGFKMHDLVTDFAILVAKDVECVTPYDWGITYLSDRIHHLSDYRCKIKWISYDLAHVKYLRTYLMPNQCSDQLSPNLLKCHSLRVLQLQLRGELSPSIGDLKYLRYLNLSKSDFKTLPEFLGKLWNLQILKLDYCKQLQKLPNSLIDLKSLVKLSFKDCHKLSSLPPQMGKLTSLRSLTSYIVGNERGFLLGELGRMELKGDLDMKHLGRVKSVRDAIEANMSSKRLNELRLSWDRNEETKLGGNEEEILEMLQPNTRPLVSLRVTGYTGGRLARWMFSPFVKKLHIERCRELKGLDEALQDMTALQSLRLYDLPNLESLPDCFETLSSLHQLAIGFCCKLMGLPKSLGLRRLKRLDIYGCPVLEKVLCYWSVIAKDSQYRINGHLIQDYYEEEREVYLRERNEGVRMWEAEVRRNTI